MTIELFLIGIALLGVGFMLGLHITANALAKRIAITHENLRRQQYACVFAAYETVYDKISLEDFASEFKRILLAQYQITASLNLEKMRNVIAIKRGEQIKTPSAKPIWKDL